MSEKEKNDKTYKHNSYGMIQLTRFQGGTPEFYGSNAKWNGGVELTITGSEVNRSDGKDKYYSTEMICRVRLTTVQLAEMLFNSNYNDGIPCTIIYTKQDGYIDYKPLPSLEEKILDDIENISIKKSNAYKAMVKQITELANNKKISKQVAESLLSSLSPLADSSDFYKNQMKKEVENLVNEAKQSVSEYLASASQTMMIETFERQAMLIETSEGKK